MDKFGRAYRLVVDATNGQQVTINPPFSVEFDITRNILSSANTSTIRIYNLAEKTRNVIYKDKNSFDTFRAVQLRAGYGSTIPLIFSGSVTHSWSVREGVNFISTIEAYDAGFAFVNSETSKSYPAGTQRTAILQDMVKTMEPTVTPGTIGNFPGSIPRGNTFVGSSVDLLRELSGGAFFVDLGKAHILNDEECLRGDLLVIKSETGLLGTPVREETILNFDMIFEPRLLIGQKVLLQSDTLKNFNGEYKVVSIKHRGMISSSVAGNAVTSVGLWHGPPFRTIN